ncbi:hypothetical protein PG990_004279 [Apiospora arundinis]
MASLLVFQMLQVQQSRRQRMGPSIGGSSTGKMAKQKPNKCKSVLQSIQQRFRAKQPIVSPLNEWWAEANGTRGRVYILVHHAADEGTSKVLRRMSTPASFTYVLPQQRKTQDGAVCIMVEGGISICPHRRVSLESIYKWKKASTTSHLCENDNPPWMLRCDICFTEFDDVLRCNAMPPTATYISTPINGFWLKRGMCLSHDCPPGNGSLCVQWNMPLPLGTKAALSENKANEGYWRTSNITPKFKKTRPLLSRLAQNYNELLCHHTKFDGERMLAELTAGLDFEASRFQLKKQNPGITLTAQGFQEIASEQNKSQYNGPDHELWSTKTQYNGTDDESWSTKPLTHDFCGVCRRDINVQPGDEVSGEYSWTLDKRGLSLQKHRRVAVPDLEAASFGCIYFRWLQAMDPPSYGLTLDEELRHVTWCPDERCCNGKSRVPNHQTHYQNCENHTWHCLGLQ